MRCCCVSDCKTESAQRESDFVWEHVDLIRKQEKKEMNINNFTDGLILGHQFNTLQKKLKTRRGILNLIQFY
jgi:hypothetical protein